MNYKLKSILLFTLFAFSILSCGAITVNKVGGWLEAAYIEFSLDSQFDGYNVYIKGGQYADYTKLDNALVRRYTDHGRADAVGLKAAAGYSFRIVPTKNSQEVTASAVTSSTLTVKAHDRSGFAFKGKQVPGAYNSDGTLKNNAVVIYVTNSNKNTLKANIIYTSKGGYQECTGILAVLTALKKGYETRPVDIRVIGCITADDTYLTNFDGTTATIAGAKEFKGDWMFSTNKKDGGGVTVEGIGYDALANGWGIRFKAINYGECRNLGFMNCHSDEGDNVGLQQDNNYCWVHHNDMFYGDAGSDADQVKGDGALDCKKSNYITMSYNHFWDNGKCNLLGLSEGVNSYADSPYYITYHHNWYDHSDSRHPRCRYYNAHVYNNYYDGNAKYGAGACLASSVFMEGNYFRSCKFPMMMSMQGSDVYAGTIKRDATNNPTFSKEAGGFIKAYNNYMTGNCTFIAYGASTYLLKGKTTAIGSINSTQDFDAFVVDSKQMVVPNTLTTYSGGNYYSNFDTSNSMYSYTAESPAQAMATVTGNYGAGRCQHGDFSWTFTNSDDVAYNVDNELKSALTNYRNTSLVGLFSDDTSSGEQGTVEPVGPGTDPEPEQPVLSGDATLASLTVTGYSLYPSFQTLTNKYSVKLTYGTTTLPAITAVAHDAKASVSLDTEDCLPDGQAVITVTAEDGTTGNYYINFTIADESETETPSGNIDRAMVFNFGEVTYKDYLTLDGCNFSTSKGSASYNGVSNTKCIKMETLTKISFTTTKAFNMTMVFGSTETGTAKVDGMKKEASGVGSTIIVPLEAGNHTITKSGTQNLFFLAFDIASLPGDANSDGTVDVSDVSSVVSHLKGVTPSNFNSSAADVDGQSGITIGDVNAIKDIILKK